MEHPSLVDLTTGQLADYLELTLYDFEIDCRQYQSPEGLRALENFVSRALERREKAQDALIEHAGVKPDLVGTES